MQGPQAAAGYPRDCLPLSPLISRSTEIYVRYTIKLSPPYHRNATTMGDSILVHKAQQWGQAILLRTLSSPHIRGPMARRGHVTLRLLRTGRAELQQARSYGIPVTNLEEGCVVWAYWVVHEGNCGGNGPSV